MSDKKKINSVRKPIIERLVKVQKNGWFWAREMKLMEYFLEWYPSVDFWQKVTFGVKLNSLAGLKSGYGKNQLDKKYREFHYKPQKSEEVSLSEEKIGEDRKITKPPTSLSDFLA